jgi:hypothetical protein
MGLGVNWIVTLLVVPPMVDPCEVTIRFIFGAE